MSYSINKTDGSILTTILDGTIDQKATDLTLIGKSSSAYGEYINENLVHLLENFANASQPSNPISGQLWYDTIQQRLKIYDGNVFKLTGGTLVADTVPSSIAQGDIWIDSKRQQLYFNDGTATILAGPYDPAETGFSIINVLDNVGLSHKVILIVIDGELFGICSNDTFTLDAELMRYTGVVNKGLTFAHQNTGTDDLKYASISNVHVRSDATDKSVVNKVTLEDSIKLAPLVLSVDISGGIGSYGTTKDFIKGEYVVKMFPAAEYATSTGTGPRCKIIASNNGAVTVYEFNMTGSEWDNGIVL